MRRIALASLMLLRTCGDMAYAAPPEGADPNSATAEWYRSLANPQTHAQCCSIADCRPVEAYEFTARGWHVKSAGQWYDVPEAAIIHTLNPTGRPVACIWGGEVKCFVEPSMS